MSSKRLSKRQLREQQELDELADVLLPTASSSAATKKSPFQQLNEPSDEGSDEDEDEHEQKVTQKKPTTTSLFAALGDGAEEQENEEDEEPDQDISTQQAPKSSKKKSKKKKKATVAAAAAAVDNSTEANLDQDAESKPPQQSKPSTGGNKKSSKKKSATSKTTTAAAKSKDVSEMSIDEFDALLASQAALNTNDTTSARSNSTNPTSTSTLNRVSAFRTHLSLDPRNLDPAIELRRQFGSAAIKAYQNESSSSTGRATSGARARAQSHNPNLKLRSLLCTPKDYWPPISRTFTGLSMDVLDSPTHGRICSWKHSKAYRQVQMQFLQAVRSYDPNALMALLRVYPFHIDTLLQLSEYSRHQGDLGQAADFNDRALFALERCASPYFTSCLSSATLGPPVVDFNKIEDRAFYLAIHRNIGFLGRRGTWRTALEWAKLLLGLGKDGEDHHGALLWIDFLAIKSRQHRWLLELISTLDQQRARASAAGGGVSHIDDLSVRSRTIVDETDKELAGEGSSYNGTLDWCVGLAYSRALALHAIETESNDHTHTRSTAALRLAIARFPFVLPLLLSPSTHPLPSHPLLHLPTQDTLPTLLTHIYTLRSSSLWSPPPLTQWLHSTASHLLPTLIADHDSPHHPKTTPPIASPSVKRGIYRHVLVSDLPDSTRQQLIGFLPPEITKVSEMMDAFDPLPPPPQNTPTSIALCDSDADKEVERVTRYDEVYFAPIMGQEGSSTSRGGEREGGGGGGEGVMQAFRRALGLGGLAGGLQGWDAAMEGVDDETREDVLAEMVMQMVRGGGEGGVMPGGFGGEEEGGEGEGEEGEGEMAGVRPGAFGAIRAAMDAIWRRAGGAQGEPIVNHEEEEEDE